jgi:hypothetical protein
LTIDSDAPLTSLKVQLSGASAVSIRRGIKTVLYANETTSGQSINLDLIPVVASSITESGPNALFSIDAASGYMSMIPGIPDLELYRSLGKFFAISMIHGSPTRIGLPVAFFTKLMGLSVDINDVRELDEAWAQTARMYMDAQTQEEIARLSQGMPIPRSGATEPVTLENRDAQIQQAITLIVSNNLPDQFAAIADGLFSVLPRSLFDGLDGKDIRDLIVGNTNVNAEELIAHIRSEMGTEQTRWLYQIIREFCPITRRRFLRFVTGVSFLTPHKISVRTDNISVFPRAQTSSRSLILPQYNSLVDMRGDITAVLNNVSASRLKHIVLRRRLDMLKAEDRIDRPTTLTGLELIIDRSEPWRSAISQLSPANATSIRAGVGTVRYINESAYGRGLTREFFSVVSLSLIGSGANALFATDADSGYERMISGLTDLELYWTLGKFFALSILHEIPTGIRLPVAFFRKLLGKSVTIDDVREFDEGWAQTAQIYMNAKSQEEILTFSLGQPEPFPGSDAKEDLTLDNRESQIQQAIENIISNNSPAQFEAIAEGFFFVLPRSLFKGFEGEDLRDWIVGNTDVGADELIEHIQSALDANRTKWLHDIIREFSPVMRQRFLRFVTGLSVIPAGGWSTLGNLSINSVPRMSHDGAIALPRAQTCFKLLRLPNYESLEEMREILTNVLTHALDAGMQER